MGYIKDRLNEVITSIHRTDPEFASALSKWQQFICTSVFTVSKLLGESKEDVLQDFLVELSKSNLEYQKQFYRYKKHLYEVSQRDGSIVHLSSNPFNIRFKHNIWVEATAIDLVKKSSLASYLYRRIQQFQADRLSLEFTKRNGYKVTFNEKAVVITGENRRKLKRKKVKNVVRVVNLVSSEEKVGNSSSERIKTIGDTLKSPDPDPLFCYEEKRMLEDGTKLSEPAQTVLNYLVLHPIVTDRILARYIGFSLRRVRAAKMEIDRGLVSKRQIPVYDRCYFDGVDFGKVKVKGSKALLALPSGRKIWANNDDVVVKPGAKPVYVSADQVR